MGRLTDSFDGWRFPAFMLAALGFFAALMFAVLLIPPSDSGLGAFAADFRIWCFGYDSAGGSAEWTYLAMMLLNPLVLSGIIVAVWWQPLRGAVRNERPALLRTAAVALVVSLVGAGGLFTLAPATSGQDVGFPARELRTALTPPAFRLTNQLGQSVAAEDMQGKVIVVTAFYASCGHTCPRILAQARTVAAGLTPAEREQVRFVGITLDPDNDSVSALATLAAGQNLNAPLFQLLTGVPTDVNRALDGFGVTRSKDVATGVIDHANLYFVIDRGGRIAYRFSLGDRQEEWMREAVRLLVAEGGEGAA